MASARTEPSRVGVEWSADARSPSVKTRFWQKSRKPGRDRPEWGENAGEGGSLGVRPCWLLNVTGGPIANKPDISVNADANGWYATGVQNSAVKVACVPLDCFNHNDITQAVKWASDSYSAYSGDATLGAPFAGSCVSGTTVGWMADVPKRGLAAIAT